MSSPTSAGAVVLCGGASRRFGSDKTRALLDGRPLLDHVLAALPTDLPVVCVGEERPTTRPVTWARESPPGGGPAAGLAAGLVALAALGTQGPPGLVVGLGGDMPYAGAAAAGLIDHLLAAPPDLDAVVARDGEGHLQPLLAAYRTTALRAALGDAPAGRSLMRVLDALRIRSVDVAGLPTADVDTPEDLDRLRHRLEP